MDHFSRQCVAIHVGQSLKGEDVVAVMEQLKVAQLAVPERIQVDNGSEFIRSGSSRKRWTYAGRPVPAYDNGVTLDFSRPGKPTARRPLTTASADRRSLNHSTGVFAMNV